MRDGHIGLSHSTDLHDYRPFLRRVACVTGSSRGIGQVTAHLLGQRGADVIVTFSTSEAVAREVVDHLRDHHQVRAECYKSLLALCRMDHRSDDRHQRRAVHVTVGACQRSTSDIV